MASTAPDGKAKISGPDGTVGVLIEEQKVVWLDVAVDDAFGMTLSNESAPITAQHYFTLLKVTAASQAADSRSCCSHHLVIRQLDEALQTCMQAVDICNRQAGHSRAKGTGCLLTV